MDSNNVNIARAFRTLYGRLSFKIHDVRALAIFKKFIGKKGRASAIEALWQLPTPMSASGNGSGSTQPVEMLDIRRMPRRMSSHR